jgi:hypothetical protein
MTATPATLPDAIVCLFKRAAHDAWVNHELRSFRGSGRGALVCAGVAFEYAGAAMAFLFALGRAVEAAETAGQLPAGAADALRAPSFDPLGDRPVLYWVGLPAPGCPVETARAARPAATYALSDARRAKDTPETNEAVVRAQAVPEDACRGHQHAVGAAGRGARVRTRAELEAAALAAAEACNAAHWAAMRAGVQHARARARRNDWSYERTAYGEAVQALASASLAYRRALDDLRALGPAAQPTSGAV